MPFDLDADFPLELLAMTQSEQREARERSRSGMFCRECGAFSSTRLCHGCSVRTRSEFRAAPTVPAPAEDQFASTLEHGPQVIPSPPRLPAELTVLDNRLESSYDAMLRTIDELRAGRPPEDEFEHEIAAAIQRNRQRDEEKRALAEAAERVERPSRYDRI